MNWKETELSYRKAAIQNATSVGLVIIMYDMLAADLRRAIEAMQAGDVEKRSAELKHAFLVLLQLEGSLDMEKGDQAARNLSQFYSVARAKILEAHIKVSAQMLQRQIDLIVDVRSAWEKVNTPVVQPSVAHEAEDPTRDVQIVSNNDAHEATASTWSA
ncbi:MAG TPA: flagellar export chaperone FliS [Terriglobales bacterium]|jgi:flagellar protein FliS